MAKETHCDYGECPYDAMYSEACRFYCGLGVDEDSYPDEEEMFDYHCNNCGHNFFIEEGYNADLDIIICPNCKHYVEES